jgi:hypothetical protein
MARSAIRCSMAGTATLISDTLRQFFIEELAP